jgi:hypothetical protein
VGLAVGSTLERGVTKRSCSESEVSEGVRCLYWVWLVVAVVPAGALLDMGCIRGCENDAFGPYCAD